MINQNNAKKIKETMINIYKNMQISLQLKGMKYAKKVSMIMNPNKNV